ncbi:gamma-secretase subunit Aph-1-like [Dermacentor andersoni]|uniref:gamma-secretase subunit Aph-1-like n=1 Tax=Dermacentor andersoni TaxID=34620 RepID=UPI002416A042|nr:gamma-secretase subunit Aph-1-like [Dermacentor andersoni]
MTLLEFTGCSLLGFGPTLSMFVLTVAGQPSRVIVFVTGSFFWLLSLLLASLTWLALLPLRHYTTPGVAIAVLSQEGFRLLFFRVLRKAERVLNAVALTGADEVARMRSRLSFAYAAGLAFGAMSALFSLLGQLADALGPGTAGLHGSTPRRLDAAAITAATFSVLHVFWALVSFHALDTRRWSVLAFAPAAHLAASAATLLTPAGDYAVSLGALCAVLVVSAAMAFNAAGGCAGNLAAVFTRGSNE